MSQPANVFIAYLAQVLEEGGSETEIFIDRITTLTGEVIETADFATFARGVVSINPDADGDSEFPEQCSFTGIDAATKSFTGVTRGLSAKNNSVVTENIRFHPAGTPVVLSFGSHNIQDLVTYVDDQVAALTVGSNLVEVGTAGEDVTAGESVYLKEADGKWWKTDADDLTTVNGVQLGIAQGTVLADALITGGILRKGIDTNQTGLTVGAYHISNTAGAFSIAAGTNIKKVGVARTSTTLYFDPNAYNKLLEDMAITGQVAFGGDGSDGILNVVSGTTTLDLSLQTVYNYTSITIAAGATLTFSNGEAGDKVPVLKCQGNFDNQGSILTKGLGVSGGLGGAACTSPAGCTATSGDVGLSPTYPFVDGTTPDGGNFGTGATGDPSGSAGLGGAVANKNSSYFAACPLNGAGGAGGGGGARASVGTPGDGGDGGDAGLGLYIEVAGNFSNTGTIDLDGNDGVQGGNAAGNGSNSWASGGGGGGGGGGAGSLVVKYKGTYTNSGTITAAGGTKGSGGPKTNTGASGGSPVYGTGGGGASGGATAFNDALAGNNGVGPSSSPTGGDGSDGGDGIVYSEKVN